MITSYNTTRSGNTTRVAVTSSLSGILWYFWFLDGLQIAVTRSPSFTVVLQPGEQATIDCIDSTSSTPPAPPARYSSKRTLEFIRSIGDVVRYRVEQQENGGAWAPIAFIPDTAGRWSYSITTAQLDDLASYAWRVVPIDAPGNDGTACAIGSETVVRTPTAPSYSIAFNSGTATISFAAT